MGELSIFGAMKTTKHSGHRAMYSRAAWKYRLSGQRLREMSEKVEDIERRQPGRGAKLAQFPEASSPTGRARLTGPHPSTP